MYICVCSPLLFKGYLVLGWGCKQKRYSNPLITRIESFERFFFLFSKPSWGRDILKGKIISCYLYKNLCAGGLAWKLQPWVASRSKEKRKRKATPHPPGPFLVVSVHQGLPPAPVCAQEPSPAVKLALHAGHGRACLLPAANVFTISREDLALCRLPCKPSGSSSACSFRGSTFANPKAVHLEAKHSVQHVAPESGFVDKANCGMASLCLFFSKPKGQTIALTPCTKAASAFSIPVFNLLCLWGICYIIIMSSDDLSNYVTYRWFYFSYGWRDMFETLVKDIIQKSQILVNLLLNGKNLHLSRQGFWGPPR